MKIVEQYIYKSPQGILRIIYKTEDGKFYFTDNGAFGDRVMVIKEMEAEYALKFINN